MYKLPDDLEKELQKKFPDAHMKKIIDSIFRSIIEKSLKDGSCFVKEFGHFSSYGKWSTKMNRKVIRFKFTVASSLERKIKTDPYYIDTIPVKAKNVFTEKHEIACKNKKTQREANLEAEKEAKQFGKNQTKKQSVIEEVNSIINEFNNGI